jgi:hypothetical protein
MIEMFLYAQMLSRGKGIVGNTHLCKFLSFRQNDEARPQTIQAPLSFEPGEKRAIPERLEYVGESFVP